MMAWYMEDKMNKKLQSGGYQKSITAMTASSGAVLLSSGNVRFVFSMRNNHFILGKTMTSQNSQALVKKKKSKFWLRKCQIAQILIFFFKSFYAAGLGGYL